MGGLIKPHFWKNGNAPSSAKSKKQEAKKRRRIAFVTVLGHREFRKFSPLLYYVAVMREFYLTAFFSFQNMTLSKFLLNFSEIHSLNFNFGGWERENFTFIFQQRKHLCPLTQSILQLFALLARPQQSKSLTIVLTLLYLCTISQTYNKGRMM